MNTHLLHKTIVSAAFSFLLFISGYRLQACTGIDLIITNITFTSVTTDTYTYTYEIKNTGTTSVALTHIALQNYVATDAQGANEKAAGGSNIVMSGNTDMIAPGATYTGTMSAYPNAVGTYPASSYPYLLVTVSIYPETECNTTNNTLAIAIEAPVTGVQTKHIADATLIWNTASKSFSVSNWSGSNNNLDYSVVTISGAVAASGKTTIDDSVVLQTLERGMYIIFLSDGTSIYSKKIIY